MYKNADTHTCRRCHLVGHSFGLYSQLILQRSDLNPQLLRFAPTGVKLILKGGIPCGGQGVLVIQLGETPLECVEILKNCQSMIEIMDTRSGMLTSLSSFALNPSSRSVGGSLGS